MFIQEQTVADLSYLPNDMAVSTWHQINFRKREKNQSITFFFINEINQTLSAFLFTERFIFSWVVWSVSQSVAKFQILTNVFCFCEITNFFSCEAFQ